MLTLYIRPEAWRNYAYRTLSLDGAWHMEGWGLICFQNEPRASGLRPHQRPGGISICPRHLPACAAAPPPGWKILCGSGAGPPSRPRSHRSSAAWPHTRLQTGILPAPGIHPPGTTGRKGLRLPRPQTSFMRADWTSPPNCVKAGPVSCPLLWLPPWPQCLASSEEQSILAGMAPLV